MIIFIVMMCLYVITKLLIFICGWQRPVPDWDAIVKHYSSLMVSSSARQNFGSLYNKATNTFSPPFSDYPVCLYQCVGKESQLNCQGVRGRIAAPALGEWILDEDEMKPTR